MVTTQNFAMSLRSIIPLIWLGLFALACTSEQRQQRQLIEKMEAALEAGGNTQQARNLARAYAEYASAFPEDHEWGARYLYRAAEIYLRLNQFDRAVEALKKALRNHYPGSNSPNNALLLGAIYEERLRITPLSQTIYQAGAEAFPDHEAFPAKVDASWTPLPERLENLASQIIHPESGQIQYRIANNYINACALQALILPHAERSPYWLFQAARTAQGVNTFDKALELLKWINEDYPDSAFGPHALFLRAFIHDQDQEDYDRAKALYEAFLERYPENELAKDARFSLEHLGKTDEDIVRSFERGM